jgi:type VI protein secretion system component Hcp
MQKAAKALSSNNANSSRDNVESSANEIGERDLDAQKHKSLRISTEDGMEKPKSNDCREMPPFQFETMLNSPEMILMKAICIGKSKNHRELQQEPE